MPAVAFFLTFSTYASHLHGDVRGSTRANRGREPANEALRAHRIATLTSEPVSLGEPAREVVLRAILDVARHRRWAIRAAHIRTEHVHVVVRCEVTPERAMNDFKAYATRALRDAGLVANDAPVWARHGSTIRLRDEAAVEAAAAYVYERQGTPMARYGST